METLLNQIAEEYQNESAEAHCLALKEILFSGMYRCGFMKDYAYAEGFDTFKDGVLFLCFLKTNSRAALTRPEYFRFLETEMNAYGVRETVKQIKNGFEVISSAEKYGIVVYMQPAREEAETELSYRLSPMPYEIRKAVVKDETRLGSVRSEFENFVSETNTEKRGPGRPRKIKPEEDDTVEKWRQPTLFDF